MRSGKSPSRGTSCRRLIREELSARQSRIAFLLLLRSLPSFPSIRSTVVHESKVYNSAGSARCRATIPRQVRHTVIIVHYRWLPPLLSFHPFRASQCPLPLSSTQRETAFHDVHTKIATPLFDDRPLSVRSLPPPVPCRRDDDVLFSLFWSQPLLSSRPRTPRERLTAETCITDSSKLLPLIALLGDIVESHVTVFTSARRGGCYELFKSFYYAMPIYIYIYIYP